MDAGLLLLLRRHAGGSEALAIVGPLKLNVQLLRGGKAAIGPGKMLVLEAIERTGSISAAGRHLGMSYRRIWLLVDSLNKDWAEKVVETRPGGGAASGASLTPFGQELVKTYRGLETAMLEGGSRSRARVALRSDAHSALMIDPLLSSHGDG